MWRTISRGTDEIEEMCNKTEENLHVSKNDTYRKIDLYEETATWSALQGSPKMFDAHDPKEVSSNIVEVIRTVLKFFFFYFYLFIYFFDDKISQAKKSTIKNKKYVWKTSKRKRVAYSLFAFDAFT